jgi:ribokinase
VLAASLDAGHGIAEAARRAAVAGSLACEQLGAQTALPRLADIERRLAELGPLRRLA